MSYSIYNPEKTFTQRSTTLDINATCNENDSTLDISSLDISVAQDIFKLLQKDLGSKKDGYDLLPHDSVYDFVCGSLDCICAAILSMIDWVVIISLTPSTYWHFMDANSLGFNCYGFNLLMLALVVLPTIILIKPIWKYFSGGGGFMLTRLGSLIFFLFGTQVHPYIRSFFTALACAMTLSRIYISNTVNEHLALFLGFAFHGIFRWSFSTINPLDIVGNSFAPSVVCVLGIGCIIHAHRPQSKFAVPTQRSIVNGSMFNYQPSNSLVINLCRAVFGAFGSGSFMFMLVYMFSSDSLLVRWNGLESYSDGYLVGLMLLGSSYLLIAANVLSSSFNDRYIYRAIHFFCWIQTFICGIVVTVCRGSRTSFYFGCLLALSIFPPTSLCLGAFQYSIIRMMMKDRFKAALIAALGISIPGTLMFYFIVSQLAWLAGTMIPIIGPIYFDNVSLVWFIPFLIALVCSLVLLVLDVLTTDKCIEEVKPLKGLKSASKSVDVGKSKYFLLSSLFFALAVLLPGARHRQWRWNKIGSIDSNENFSILTWNIQQGYSFMKYPAGSGFLVLQEIVEVINSLRPHIVALQETETSHLLHGLRDTLGYLSERTQMTSYYGCPSWNSSSGLSFLYAGANVTNLNYQFLPQAGGHMNRLCISGEVSRRDPKTSEITSTHVINTHLSAFSAEARIAQMEGVMEVINSFSGPVILLGDFNSPPIETGILWNNTNIDEDKALKIVQFVDEPPTDLPNFAHIDHIYYRGFCVVNKKILNVAGYSDHMPVYAEFMKLPPTGVCPQP